jgi:hypothetical protein
VSVAREWTYGQDKRAVGGILDEQPEQYRQIRAILILSTRGGLRTSITHVSGRKGTPEREKRERGNKGFSIIAHFRLGQNAFFVERGVRVVFTTLLPATVIQTHSKTVDIGRSYLKGLLKDSELISCVRFCFSFQSVVFFTLTLSLRKATALMKFILLSE